MDIGSRYGHRGVGKAVWIWCEWMRVHEDEVEGMWTALLIGLVGREHGEQERRSRRWRGENEKGVGDKNLPVVGGSL